MEKTNNKFTFYYSNPKSDSELKVLGEISNIQEFKDIFLSLQLPFYNWKIGLFYQYIDTNYQSN